MMKIVLTSLGVLAMVALGVLWFACPCAIVPGGPLAGEERSEVVNDWTFANDVRLCQVEVNAFVPYSVNVNCMSTGGALYVSCSNCEGKFWSSRALADAAGRIRVGPLVFPVTLTRLATPSALDTAWRARAAKLGLGEDVDRPGHWWSFELVSR